MARTANRWSLAEPDPVAEGVLARELGVRPLLARLLVNRALREPAIAASFLECSLSRSLRSPMLFSEMRTAAERVLQALRRRERIAIYGDYDVDGITASTQLMLFLRELGCEPILHIPHRLRHGYGLKAAALRELAERGARLVITADCGAAAHPEIAEAGRLGLDVIVCDHHQNPAVRPPALAVLNPVTSDAGFPFSGLSAAGVVFYLLMGSRMLLRETGGPVPDLRRYLDLVALGTVSDLVPLLEENRVLVKYGLREIAVSGRPGLRALLEVGGVEEVTVDSLGFRLGPRLNASGRLADAARAVELLTSRDLTAARPLAIELDRQNRDRRGIEGAIVEEAEQMIRAMEDRDRRRSFVLASEGWHAGVVGIVASRVVDRHFRPVVLLAVEGDVARGSARGIPSVHLFEALRGCGDLLERYGGHRMAAGLTIRVERVKEFADRFEDIIATTTPQSGFVPELNVDARVGPDELDAEAMEDIEKLEPYGQANPRPLFLAEGLEVVSSRIVGERHLKLALRRGGGRKIFDAMAFGRGDEQPAAGMPIDVVFSPEISRWDGYERFQLIVKDLRDSSVKTMN
ncbi:MAG TPA: single-stranded-DNA-specific exonuclease RecJ [Candidatus Binatia bacterium]|nr:single-stranded-DNA-specific exonuclease RecJ [Candidatus Binatia bacterium]